MYVVYVLYSEKFNKIYIGFTHDLENRLKSHNELGKKGWTKTFDLGQFFTKKRLKKSYRQ